MTVTTVFATAPGGTGAVSNSNASYATAQAGTGTFALSENHRVGQQNIYACRQGFVIFDTSGIPDTDDASAVVLSLDGAQNSSDDDFEAVAAISAYDGGATVNGDFVAGASLGALTAVATWNSSGYSAAYNAFTDNGSFGANINKTGNTSLILFSANQRDNVTPTGNEFVFFTDADAAGTTTDPKLDITHDTAAAGGTPMMAMMGVGT